MGSQDDNLESQRRWIAYLVTRGLRAAQPLAREFQPFLNEMVVVDHPDLMTYVNVESVHGWGVAESDIFDRARANLAARALAPAAEESEQPERPAIIRMVESGSEYWASNLLLDGWLAMMADHVGGRPVAFLPDTNGLTIADDDPAVIGELLKVNERAYLGAARPVSPQAYTVDDAGRVVPYSVPAGDPLWNPVHRSAVLFASRAYAAQEDDYGDDDLLESFLATLMVAERPDGGLHSMAVWGEDVDSLLPEADYVAFVNERREHFVVAWEVATREAGLAPEPGWSPARYRVRAWPDPPVVERLRAAAVSLQPMV